MKRLLILLFLLPVLAWGRDVWPEDFTGNDQAKIESAIKECIKDPNNCATLRLDFRGNLSPNGKLKSSWSYYKPLVVKDLFGRPLWGFRIIGGRRFSSLQFTGTGDALTIWEAKGCRIDDLGLQRTGDFNGRGIVFEATGSVNATVDHLIVSNATVGLDFNGPDADVSMVQVNYSMFERCSVDGVRITGPNALDLDCRYVTGAHCGTVVDCRQGGSGYVLDHIGGSSCDYIVRANGGYCGTIRDITGELTKICGVELEGKDGGGFVSMNFLDFRGSTCPAARIGCDASIDLGINRSAFVEGIMESNVGKLELKGGTFKALQGKWIVNGLPNQ